MLAGECFEVVNKVRLIVITAFIRDLSQRFIVIAISIQCSIKPHNAQIQLRAETRERLKFPFQLPGRQAALRRKLLNIGKPVVLYNMIDQ